MIFAYDIIWSGRCEKCNMTKVVHNGGTECCACFRKEKSEVDRLLADSDPCCTVHDGRVPESGYPYWTATRFEE
jgi:protein-arginine kinase activator protein McsA